MTLAALQHLLRSAAALADDRRFLVLGSASLLATFPELGEADPLLATTYDADLCPEPFDELTGAMLDEALGENQAYFRRHGYRPISIPPRNRLITHGLPMVVAGREEANVDLHQFRDASDRPGVGRPLRPRDRKGRSGIGEVESIR